MILYAYIELICALSSFPATFSSCLHSLLGSAIAPGTVYLFLLLRVHRSTTVPWDRDSMGLFANGVCITISLKASCLEFVMFSRDYNDGCQGWPCCVPVATWAVLKTVWWNPLMRSVHERVDTISTGMNTGWVWLFINRGAAFEQLGYGNVPACHGSVRGWYDRTKLGPENCTGNRPIRQYDQEIHYSHPRPNGLLLPCDLCRMHIWTCCNERIQCPASISRANHQTMIDSCAMHKCN